MISGVVPNAELKIAVISVPNAERKERQMSRLRVYAVLYIPVISAPIAERRVRNSNHRLRRETDL
jgi:hypothetical protein